MLSARPHGHERHIFQELRQGELAAHCISYATRRHATWHAFECLCFCLVYTPFFTTKLLFSFPVTFFHFSAAPSTGCAGYSPFHWTWSNFLSVFFFGDKQHGSIELFQVCRIVVLLRARVGTKETSLEFAGCVSFAFFVALQKSSFHWRMAHFLWFFIKKSTVGCQ